MKRKILIFVSGSFILLMTILFIYYLIKGDSSRWQVSLGAIIVSALPLFLLILKSNPINLPIIISYYLFIFCAVILGSIASFYLRFTWWDSTLHFFKGILIGCIGISLYKQLVPAHARKDSSKWLLFLFVLSLSVTASVLWEIYEFLGDLTFTNTMQRGGNKDTMIDLICGTAGAVIIAIYSYVRKPNI